MAMASDPAIHGGKKAGTLVVVVMKAKNLPNRQKIGKQDPYCIVRLGHSAERTKTDKRGGQAPFWDHETRFAIPLNAGPEHQLLKVSVFSDDSKEPVLIGDTSIDLKPVFKEGEFDDWVELKFKNRYSGEVYLEMTYYSEAPPPVPALPKEVQSRNLQSRGGSQSSQHGMPKRRPLPQQPNSGPPPSRGYPQNAYDQLPPPSSRGRPMTSSHPQEYYDDYNGDPYGYEYPHPRQHSLDHEYPQHSEEYHHNLPPPESPTLGRHRSETSLRSQYYERPELEAYPPPPAALSGRPESHRRPRKSLPLPTDPSPYSDPRYPPPPSSYVQEMDYSRTPRRQSLDDYYDTPPQAIYLPIAPTHTEVPYRQEHYPPEDYLPIEHYPPPPGHYTSEQYTAEPQYSYPPQKDERGYDEEIDEPIPIHPYKSQPPRQLSPPPPRSHSEPQHLAYPPEPPPSHRYSPSSSATYDHPAYPSPSAPYDPAFPPRDPPTGYSPHLTQKITPPRTVSPRPYTAQPPQGQPAPRPYTAQTPTTRPYTSSSQPPRPYTSSHPPPIRQYSTPPQQPQSQFHTPPQPTSKASSTYSPTPPPHRTPPSRQSNSPRTPVKPVPVRPHDHLPPSSYAPSRLPTSALPLPPSHRSNAPDIPAKIPLGMTEREYLALQQEEEVDARRARGTEGYVEVVSYKGLEDGGWKEMREALPTSQPPRDYRR